MTIFKQMTGALIGLLAAQQLAAQSPQGLQLREIMKGHEFVGHLPEDIRWSLDGEKIYFLWNPDKTPLKSLYSVLKDGGGLQKVSAEEEALLYTGEALPKKSGALSVYSKNGDLVLFDALSKSFQKPLQTIGERETEPHFVKNGAAVAFSKNGNLFLWDIKTKNISQLTDIKPGKAPFERKSVRDKEIESEQLALFGVLAQRAQKEKLEKEKRAGSGKNPKTFYADGKNVSALSASPDAAFVAFRLSVYNDSERGTDVPSFVTESGYTENLPSRAKVGGELPEHNSFVYDVAKDTIVQLDFSSLPGIKDAPAYYAAYNRQADGKNRKTVSHGPFWSPDGKRAVFIVRALDHKDRWFAELDLKSYALLPLYRQHDDAWIGGPGIDNYDSSPGDFGWLPGGKSFWFQSEEDGYSQLYSLDADTKKTARITEGKFEVRDASLSQDGKHFYFTSNQDHPGERQLYKIPVTGGKAEKITSGEGAHLTKISPDEKHIADLFSFSNKPWELFVQENKAGAKAKQITESLTPQFKAYPWRSPEVVTFKASDGAMPYARLYKPDPAKKNGAAVIFVHGAGYLQNAHKYWSNYFREFMFHNMLTDEGFTVLDIDYRGSEGYGRDWRTGIYRHMGGKDLSDHVDGAAFLAAEHGVDPKRIGIYGGSYGGFITLMGMFNSGETFKAGAALRSVTDWQHYNDGYTSNILNTPALDSIAYRRSSPIYFAEGLKNPLLICHGMIDTNVQFQDVARLSQRLIELGKEDWEMAVYPLEDHGFVESSSWADEYSRIYKLFKKYLLG